MTLVTRACILEAWGCCPQIMCFTAVAALVVVQWLLWRDSTRNGSVSHLNQGSHPASVPPLYWWQWLQTMHYQRQVKGTQCWDLRNLNGTCWKIAMPLTGHLKDYLFLSVAVLYFLPLFPVGMCLYLPSSLLSLLLILQAWRLFSISSDQPHGAHHAMTSHKSRQKE